jgi:AraC family transcriptional regulator
MEPKPAMQLEKPRFETHRAFLVAGFRGNFPEPPKGLPELWGRFGPHIGKIPGQVGRVAYGVASAVSPQGACDYTAGVEVTDFSALSNDFTRITIPANRYAVFAHHDHVSTLADTIDRVLRTWLPQSGLALQQSSAGGPVFFERYGEAFDPQAGRGDVEVWFPAKS